MQTATHLRQSALARLKQLRESLDHANEFAQRLDLNALDSRFMHSIRESLTLSQQYFHEFSAYSNALLTGDLNANERSDVTNKP